MLSLQRIWKFGLLAPYLHENDVYDIYGHMDFSIDDKQAESIEVLKEKQV